jgi:RecA-family ATPase
MNISNKVRPFFDNYQELIREFKCSVVFIHHIGKSRENMALHKNQVLGSVGIVDKARQVLWLSRGKKTSTERQLTIIKGNYVSDEEKNKSLILNFDAESRTFEYLEEKGIKNPNISHNESIDDETKQDIYDLIKAGTKREVIADTLGIHRVTLWRFLKKNPPPADNNKSKQIEEYLL